MTSPLESVQRWAAVSPERLAIAGVGTRLTYGQLWESVTRVAARMRLLGVRPGHIVACALPPALEVVFALAALHEAAASATLPAVRGASSLAAFHWVFTVPGRTIEESSGAGAVVTVDDEWLAVASSVTRTPERRPMSRGDLCRLVYSSGTTGSPKAVPLTVEGLARRVELARDLWMAPSPFMSLLGLSTASGLLSLMGALTTGATYLIPGGPKENLALLREFDVACLKASPLQLDALAIAMSPVPTYLPHLRRIQSAGGFLPEALATRLRRVFDCEVVNVYGSSEVGTVSLRTGESCDPCDAGVVVADVEVEVVDSADRPVPAGVTGVIRYRRSHQARGYFHDEGASEAHFRQGWFYPGDNGALLGGGRLRVEGRASEVLNAAGAKVDPALLESQALEYGGLADVAAFMASSEDEVARIALAFVADAEPDINDLALFLRHRLGGSAPLAYVRVAAIPRNDMGKVMRHELALRYAELLR